MLTPRPCATRRSCRRGVALVQPEGWGPRSVAGRHSTPHICGTFRGHRTQLCTALRSSCTFPAVLRVPWCLRASVLCRSAARCHRGVVRCFGSPLPSSAARCLPASLCSAAQPRARPRRLPHVPTTAGARSIRRLPSGSQLPPLSLLVPYPIGATPSGRLHVPTCLLFPVPLLSVVVGESRSRGPHTQRNPCPCRPDARCALNRIPMLSLRCACPCFPPSHPPVPPTQGCERVVAGARDSEGTAPGL